MSYRWYVVLSLSFRFMRRMFIFGRFKSTSTIIVDVKLVRRGEGEVERHWLGLHLRKERRKKKRTERERGSETKD